MHLPRNFPKALVLIAFSAVLPLAAIFFTQIANAQMPGGEMGPTPVQVSTVKQEDVRLWKEYPGRLVAVDYAEIRPQVSGIITEVMFEDGQYVEKDDVLFVIDPRPYEADLKAAKAALLSGQSNYNLAKKELTRGQELVKRDAVSQRIVDERKSRLDLALAEINAAKAQIQQAEINLDRAHVKAPISGRTSRAEITQGNLIEAGLQAPKVTTIVNDAQIYVDFEVDEATYFSHVREQARSKEDEQKIPVEVILGRDNDESVQGVIHTFDNRINPVTGTIRARAIIENENGAYLPGMFAKARIGGAETVSRLMVPAKAVGTDQDRKFVYTIDAEGKVAYNEVKLGDRVGQQRVVLEGLNAGDTIITEGILKLGPGMPVKPAEQKQAQTQTEETAPKQLEAPTSEPEPKSEPEMPEAEDASKQGE